MRTVLAVDLTIAILLFGPYAGFVFADYTRGQRLTVTGFFILTVAVLGTQNKAVNLHVPFDGYSWALVAGVTVINCGLGLSLWERRPRKRE